MPEVGTHTFRDNGLGTRTKVSEFLYRLRLEIFRQLAGNSKCPKFRYRACKKTADILSVFLVFKKFSKNPDTCPDFFKFLSAFSDPSI